MTAKLLTQEEIIQLQNNVENYLSENSFIRKGQALFNCLHAMHPDIADEIRTTDADPFYNDSKIEDCWKTITE